MPASTDPYSTDDLKWRAFERRDLAAVGYFLCAVRTTGVYCLPSCAGRPKRENTLFYDSRLQAERDGFRPCKRCRPDAA